MNWIDLQTGYMVSVFKEIEEVERAKEQMKAEGKEVICAKHRNMIQEHDAKWWVLSSLDKPNMFLDYTFNPARGSCLTAKESLGTALELVYERHHRQYPYLVIIKV